MTDFVVLSTDQMRAGEAAAIAGGTSGAGLMENAGVRASEIIMRAWNARPAVVLCGPGNNGGDGFVIARQLKEAGWPVRVGVLGSADALAGDAKLMAGLLETPIEPIGDVGPALLEGAGLIVDALFGTGLARDLDGAALAIVNAVNIHPAPAVAIDIPSGVNADTGAVMGAAVQATRTLTFQFQKPGHLLFPGRAFAGAVDVVDIGIDAGALKEIRIDTLENQPAIWGREFRRPTFQTHKYDRGHVFVMSGGRYETGAARLGARAALRTGAGLVTMLSPSDAAPEHAAHLTTVMLRVANTPEEIAGVFRKDDKHQEVALIGPAAGVDAGTRDAVLAVLKTTAGVVLDADALSVFASEADVLFSALRGEDVLTPHEGEFQRLFASVIGDGRLARARAAAKTAGAVVVLKGADTVVAAPDGRAAINVNAPPDLATAGAGDVLAGCIAGLKAQGMPGFEAACAGVWLHGAAGQAVGPGLIASDLLTAIPSVLRALLTPPAKAPADQTQADQASSSPQPPAS